MSALALPYLQGILLRRQISGIHAGLLIDKTRGGILPITTGRHNII